MKRLKILVIGSSLTDSDRDLVLKSLKYFTRKEGLSNEIAEKVVFEDVVAKQDSHEIGKHANEYGYVLVLGRDASDKLENTNTNIDIVEYHTLRPIEWGGLLRDRVVEQLEGIINA